MNYALDEFWRLLNDRSSQDNVRTYLCALVAELAYHHVPQFEIDEGPKRAKLVVPSDSYRRIVTAGVATNVIAYLQGLDLARAFVAVDRAVIAVGFVAGDRLFIGFRGTAFLFDWRINLTAPLIPVFRGLGLEGLLWPGVGRLHRGFAEEAVRISAKVREEVSKLTNQPVREVYLCGHSLGGAVAAISEGLLGSIGNSSIRIFGAPRYADAGHYFSKRGILPLQVKRAGDIVPATPPKRLGYADHPREYDTRGNQHATLHNPFARSFLWCAALFLGKAFEPHNMEGYRRELGAACGAEFADQPLSDYEKLTRANVYADTLSVQP